VIYNVGGSGKVQTCGAQKKQQSRGDDGEVDAIHMSPASRDPYPAVTMTGAHHVGAAFNACDAWINLVSPATFLEKCAI
jgi:hypothetical protein